MGGRPQRASAGLAALTFVDSSVWIDNLRHRVELPHVQALLRLVERAEPIVVGDVVLMEVLMGATDPQTAARLEASLSQFPIQAVLDANLAVVAARNYRKLRQAGRTIRSSVDMMIGTFCNERDYPLLHNDRDFEPMHDLLGLRRAPISPP